MKLPASLIRNFLFSEFRVKPVSGSNELRICSPFTDDKKFHLYIDPEKGVYTDFKISGCGSGSILNFAKEYFSLKNEKDAAVYIIQNYGTAETAEKMLPEIKAEPSEVIKKFLANDKPVFFGDCKELGIFGRKCLKYLQGRKINDDYISRMGYVFNEKSRYNGRIIIPFFENSQFVYFQARDTNKETELRYLNPEKLDTKEFVFNIDDISDELIIAEGPFDAMSMDEQVATSMESGDIGIKQINKIFSKHPNTIIYCPDQDETGRLKTDKNIENLYRYCPYTSDLNIYIFNVPKPFKDLNEMKVGNGKNFILKKECELYKRKIFKEFEFKNTLSI